MAIAQQLTSKQIQRKIPTTMTAAVYRGKEDVRLETVPVPKIRRGEILVEVHTCGICGTDLKKIATGSHSAPRIFGHETADRKSTRLNSSHLVISYAVFCLKKKTQ